MPCAASAPDEEQHDGGGDHGHHRPDGQPPQGVGQLGPEQGQRVPATASRSTVSASEARASARDHGRAGARGVAGRRSENSCPAGISRSGCGRTERGSPDAVRRGRQAPGAGARPRQAGSRRDRRRACPRRSRAQARDRAPPRGPGRTPPETAPQEAERQGENEPAHDAGESTNRWQCRPYLTDGGRAPWSREGSADLKHLDMVFEQGKKAARRPVLEMTGRVAEGSPIATACHVQHAPERLAGHADDQVRLRQAGEQRERARGSARCSSTSQQTTSSAPSSGGLRSWRSATRMVTGSPSAAARCRAIATAAALMSLPRTARPLWASMVLRKPSPQPTSCTCFARCARQGARVPP